MLVHTCSRLNNYQDMTESILSSVVNDTGVSNRKIYYAKYLKILYDKYKSDTIIKEAINMHQQFPDDKLPLGEFCQCILLHSYCMYVYTMS